MKGRSKPCPVPLRRPGGGAVATAAEAEGERAEREKLEEKKGGRE